MAGLDGVQARRPRRSCGRMSVACLDRCEAEAVGETGVRFLAVVMVDGKTSSAGGGSAMDDGLSEKSNGVCKGRSGKRRHVFVPRQKIGDALKKRAQREDGPTLSQAPVRPKSGTPVAPSFCSPIPQVPQCPKPSHPKSPSACSPAPSWLIIAGTVPGATERSLLLHYST